jgi:hypothetical protein
MECKQFREFAKDMVDYIIDYLENIRDRYYYYHYYYRLLTRGFPGVPFLEPVVHLTTQA